MLNPGQSTFSSVDSDVPEMGRSTQHRGSVLSAGSYSFRMSSFVVFSVDVRRLAVFYEAVLGVKPKHEPSGDIRLLGDQVEVLVHSVPAKIAKTMQVRIPPQPREESAIKPIFDVESLEVALEQVTAKGGVITDRAFSLDGLTRNDVIDPDGNVIQLRSRRS